MKFVVNFNSREVSGRTREEVLSKITSGTSYVISSNLNGYRSFDGKTARLYYLQKFNKKSSQKQKIVGGKNTTFTKVIRKPSWKGSYIDVPVELIESSNQKSRSFNLKLRNR